MSQILAITGMHRSGTSLISSLLQAGGVHVGETLLPADASNPRGYFEDIDFCEFQESLLSRRGQHYLYIDSDFVFEPTQLDKNRALELRQQRSHRPIWGWKDPRTSLFLDFWAEQYPEAKFLFVVRHPLEVLCSLLRRGEFEHLTILDAALHAWRTYNANIRSFRDRHPDRCLLVHIEGVLQHIRRFASLVREKLGLDLRLDETACRNIYHGEELRRIQHSPEETAVLAKLYPGVLELYHQLTAHADLPADASQESAVASPQLSALAALAASMTEPVTLPVKQSLLALLLCSHAPELAKSKLTSFGLADRDFQQRINRLWVQYKQLERVNSEQLCLINQQTVELKELRSKLDERPRRASNAQDPPTPQTVPEHVAARNRPLLGFNRVFSVPAQLRMPERVALYSLIYGIQPRNCLEIGSAQGGSAAIICAAMDDLGFGQLACIDPAPQISPKLWSEISHRCRMFEGMSPGIVAQAHQDVGAKFDFALIDGDHTYDAVRADIEGVLPYLTDEAHLLFHDAHHDPVKKAIHDSVMASSQLTDCGLMSVEQTILEENGRPVAYAGYRLLRFHRSAAQATAGNHVSTTAKSAIGDQSGSQLHKWNSAPRTITYAADRPYFSTERASIDIKHQRGRFPVILAGTKCLSGVTTWAERLREEMADHPRYDVRLLHVGDERPDGYDLYAANVDEARALVNEFAPAVLVPNYVWELYLAGCEADIYCLGMCHSHSFQEYYLPLTWYESRISQFIAVSPECAQQLAERLPFRTNDIATLPYGVRVPQELTRNYETDPLRIIYAGRLTQQQKRVGDFVRMVEHLSRARVPFVFDIVGDGEELAPLQHAMRQWFPAVQARFHGRVPHEQVDGMWSSADVFVQTSDFEGVSVSMLDAMAQGVVPVVTAASSGVAGVIEDNCNGFVVPVGDMAAMADVIARLAANQPLLAAVGQAAHQSARAFAMDAYRNRFTEVLDRIVGDGQKPEEVRCEGGFGGYHPIFTQHHIIRRQATELAALHSGRGKLPFMRKLIRSIRKRIPSRPVQVEHQQEYKHSDRKAA